MNSTLAPQHVAPQDEEPQALIALAGIAPIAVGALLVPLREHLAIANLAMILMGVVVLAALAGGRIAGAVAAVTATMSFDFFLTRPYLSMRITSPDDVETAAILLLVGGLVGQFAARARAARSSRNISQSDLARLHRLAELNASGASAAAMIDACRQDLIELLDLQDCHFEEVPFDTLPALGRDGRPERRPAHVTTVRHARHGVEIPTEGLALVVLSGGHTRARFVLEPKPGGGMTPQEGLVAVALADQVGASLERSQPAARPTCS